MNTETIIGKELSITNLFGEPVKGTVIECKIRYLYNYCL